MQVVPPTPPEPRIQETQQSHTENLPTQHMELSTTPPDQGTKRKTPEDPDSQATSSSAKRQETEHTDYGLMVRLKPSQAP